MRLDEELREMAEAQHGVVTRAQARAAGATSSSLAHRLAGPDWAAPTARVLRLVGAPQTSSQALMTAVLDAGPGTVASHTSAAAVWQVPGFSLAPLHLSRERGTAFRRTDLATVHRPRNLPGRHVTTRRGIPVTTLPRTLFDLAGAVHPARVERAVDTVLAKSPALLSVLHSLLAELAEHGRNGIAVMRAILDARPAGYVAPASGLEARFMRIITEAGERPLDRQVDAGGHEWLGRVDFVDRRARILVEIDSARYHTSKLDGESDRRRDEAFLAAGWRAVVRVSEEQVWHRPEVAVAAVRRARRAAAAATPVLAAGSHAHA